MRPISFDDAKAFYERVQPPFAACEIENSFFLGMAKRPVDTGEPALRIVLEDDGAIRAAALRTPPFALAICGVDRPTIERLAEAVYELDPTVASVTGLEELVTAFADRWVAKTGRPWRTGLDMTFYALQSVEPSRDPAGGALRLAARSDQAWLTTWYAAFADEAGLPERERGLDNAYRFTRGKIARAEQFVWEVDGRPVAFLGFTPTGITGARVGPVMTAAAERRKGYASAAIAALCRHLLDTGHTWCGLFADVRNPDSNRVYQRLGFREACRYRSIEL